MQHFLDRFRRDLGLPPGKTDLVLSPSSMTESLAAALEAGVPLVNTALGDPRSLIEPTHAAGARVMAMVATVAEAVRVAAGTGPP